MCGQHALGGAVLSNAGFVVCGLARMAIPACSVCVQCRADLNVQATTTQRHIAKVRSGYLLSLSRAGTAKVCER